MKSMTGFGRAEASGDDFLVSVELKSVNNRFLDIKFRLPAELQSIEPAIKATLAETFSRGRIDVNIKFRQTGLTEFELNRPLISGYLEVFKKLKDEYGLSGEPDLNVVARLPHALEPKAIDLSSDASAGIEKALFEALSNIQEMRETEGHALRQDLLERLQIINGEIDVIERESENVAEEYYGRLMDRITNLLAKAESIIEIDESRLAAEAALIADKSDISEEITRLNSHIRQFSQMIGEGGINGKRLDFLTQELNREANTIGSKTQNMIVKNAALAIKSEIEKIREQVQNIE